MDDSEHASHRAATPLSIHGALVPAVPTLARHPCQCVWRASCRGGAMDVRRRKREMVDGMIAIHQKKFKVPVLATNGFA